MSLDVVVDTPDALAHHLVQRVETLAAQAVAARGRFALALPGSSVATTFFPHLATARIDQRRTEFFWGDERAVPPSHPASNYGIARELWLEPAKVPPARVHRMPADQADLEAAADAYAQELTGVLGAAPRLDLALLGMGPDGHICSLFPGHPALREEVRPVVPILDAPKAPARRLTLTLPALARADLVIVAALGASKAPAIQQALSPEASDLPVALLVRRARRAAFFLDGDAASLISGR